MSDDPTRRIDSAGDRGDRGDPAMERTQRLDTPGPPPPAGPPPTGPPPAGPPSAAAPPGWAGQTPVARVVHHRTSGAAVTALVLGILVLVFGLLPVLNLVALLLAVPAVLFAIGGLAATSREGVDGRGMAVGGLVCGLLGLLAAVALLFAMNAVFNEARRAFGDGAFEGDFRQRLEQRLERRLDEEVQSLRRPALPSPTARGVSG